MDETYCCVGRDIAERRAKKLEEEKADLLAEVNRLRAAQSWISVADKLPDEPGIYLVYYLEDQAYGSLWFSPLDGFNSRVTHWVPLLEPPQEPQPQPAATQNSSGS